MNGKKVAKATLSDGDKLTVGRVLFAVATEPATRSTAFYERSTVVLRVLRAREILQHEWIGRLLAADGRFRDRGPNRRSTRPGIANSTSVIAFNSVS